MTLVDNQQSAAKTNAFRIGVDQPLLGTGPGQNASTPANYCKHMMRSACARIQQDQQQFTNFATPVADTGNNLFTFMAARLSGSFDNLGCGALLNAPNPVNLTLDDERRGHRGHVQQAGHRHPARRGAAQRDADGQCHRHADGRATDPDGPRDCDHPGPGGPHRHADGHRDRDRPG